MKKKDLIANLSQISKVEQAPEIPPAETPVDSPPVGKISTGKTSSFRLDEEDRKLIRERSEFLYGQGIKPSDTLVLRAAIRLIGRDHRFVETIRELMVADRRVQRHKIKL